MKWGFDLSDLSALWNVALPSNASFGPVRPPLRRKKYLDHGNGGLMICLICLALPSALEPPLAL